MCAFLNKYLYPFGGYVEKICFRISCLRGRSSSSSPPGFVREDEKLVNTVPVVCFCRFWRNCLSSVQRYRIRYSPPAQRWIFLVIQELWFLDYFFILVQLYSNQGVSCRNIGQEQLRVKQSFSARMTIKNSLFGFNSNGLLNHGKEGKTRYYVIQCRFSEFLIQLCIKKTLFWGSVQKYYYYVQKYCLFWGPCRNITIQEPGGAGFSCRAIFGVCADIFIFGEIFTSGD